MVKGEITSDQSCLHQFGGLSNEEHQAENVLIHKNCDLS